MTTSSPGTPPAPVWRIAVLALATILALLAVRADPASAAIDGVPLPVAAGSTWEVVAGYNTYTHVGGDPHALDIVRVDADTAGSEVRSPVAGQLRYFGGDCLTVQDENGMRHLICHIWPVDGVQSGAQVERGDLLATVAPAGYAGNNGLPHIRYAIHQHFSSGLQTVPFTGEYALEGRNLFDSGTFLEHSGLRLTSSSGAPLAEPVLLPQDRPEIVASVAADPSYLVPGWNLLGWTGDADLAVAIEPIATQISSLYTYDSLAQRFRAWSPALPVALRDIESLEFGTGVWVYVQDDSGLRWTRPQVELSRAVPLTSGFNLVSWTAGVREIGAALASLGDDVTAVFAWDPLAQRYLAYRVDAPSFLNDLEVLLPGQAVWVEMRRAADWQQT